MRFELVDRIGLIEGLEKSLETAEKDEKIDDLQKSMIKLCMNYTIKFLQSTKPIIVEKED